MRSRLLLLLALALLLPMPASAIPVFARRYRVSCQLCHNPVPALTPFVRPFFGASGGEYRFTVAATMKNEAWQ